LTSLLRSSWGRRGERKVQWSPTASNPVEYTTCKQERTLGSGDGEQGRDGKAHSSSA